MESVLKSAVRKFVSEEHLKNVLAGEFVTMYDELGNALEGIRGRMGAVAIRTEGEEIGVDYICMDPGSSFPLHVHAGDHILYIISDQIGLVHINGEDHAVKKGDSIFIPAEYAHGVKTHPEAKSEFQFLAFGCPHVNLGSTHRMTQVNEKGEKIHDHKHSHTYGHSHPHKH